GGDLEGAPGLVGGGDAGGPVRTHGHHGGAGYVVRVHRDRIELTGQRLGGVDELSVDQLAGGALSGDHEVQLVVPGGLGASVAFPLVGLRPVPRLLAEAAGGVLVHDHVVGGKGVDELVVLVGEVETVAL